MNLQEMRKSLVFKGMLFVQSFAFIFSSLALPAKAYAQSVVELPAPGMMVATSDAYVPVMLRAVKIHPDQPLVFDFIVDSGNTKADRDLIKTETQKLVKYFLASLTISEKDMWVNLSPYEHDRIVPEAFGDTQMGRDLLAQDYVLKQLSSSMIYPEKALGKEFWARVYAKARETMGTNELPMNTFNKVWIMPDKAEVYEMNNTAIVGQSHLKVLMEEDYLALQKNSNDRRLGTDQLSQADVSEASKASSKIMRELVLPEIEKEVNTGKNFALLRQVYQSLILATWYKNNLKESLLAQVYANKNKTAGVDVLDKGDKEAIYQRYVEAYKEGVFNYIREERNPVTNELFPRKYFSGGGDFAEMSRVVKTQLRKVDNAGSISTGVQEGDLNQVTVAVVKSGNNDRSQLSTDVEVFVKSLKLAGFDKGYLQGLFAKFREDSGKKKNLVIDVNFVPSARLTFDERDKFLGAKDYLTQIHIDSNKEAAKKVVLWANEMNGGLGASLVRERYLKENFNRDNIAAKGTDMYFFLDVQGVDIKGVGITFNNIPVSTTELKYLQVLNTSNVYGGVMMQELVNNESLEPMREFLDKTKYLADRFDLRIPDDKKRTYRQILIERGITIPPEIVQASLPVIDIEKGALTDEFLAPGGHGQLGSMVLQDILTTTLLPKDGKTLIRTVYNGDGTNNAPDPYIVGWMARNKIPIVMISTTKTVLDKKGGLLGAEKSAGEGYVTDLLEIAQAKANGQKGLFGDMGLTIGEKGGQFFNTNIALVNYSVLQPFLNELHEIIKADEYAKIVTPDLILNKKQKGADKKEVYQLEGAMGSALLNLNRFVLTTKEPKVHALMQKYGFDRLLYIVNVDQNSRDQFFTPVKFAWDHWLYAYSGHFRVDQVSAKLVNNIPGHLPGFGAMNKPYEDLQNVIDALGNANVDELDELSIQGVVTREQFQREGLDFDAIMPALKEAELVTEIGGVSLDFKAFDDKFKERNPGLSDEVLKKVQGILQAKQKGLVKLSGAKLVGKVLIENRSGKDVDLNKVLIKYKTADGKLLLSNIDIVIQEDGTVSEPSLLNGKEHPELDSIAVDEAVDNAENSWNRGGIDFNPAALNLKVERTGKGVTVHVDPAEIQRIKDQGVTGFTPVIINIVPVKGILPALGLAPERKANVTG